MERNIRTVEDVLRLLDGMFPQEADRWTSEAAGWWDRFYADRSRDVPFFVAKPDESLASFIENSTIAIGSAGRALDLGCGPGRNALYLASRGFLVDAVDLSPAALDWARERAREQDLNIAFHCRDAFDASYKAPGATRGDPLCGPYDLIYDSGCLHHLPPHRRISYLALLDRALAPGGYLGLTCFAAGVDGSELSDADLYRQGSLEGGVAYTPESLRWIFSGLAEIELRRMRDEPTDSAYFGEPFLTAALFRRDPGAEL